MLLQRLRQETKQVYLLELGFFPPFWILPSLVLKIEEDCPEVLPFSACLQLAAPHPGCEEMYQTHNLHFWE